jgi:hypothetical protein
MVGDGVVKDIARAETERQSQVEKRILRLQSCPQNEFIGRNL